MTSADRDAPVRFLRTAFEAGDTVGVLLKTYRTGEALQRMVSLETVMSDRFQAWLRHMNAHEWNVYVSVNAYRPGRSRARAAVAHVRHLFLEEDRDGPGLLAALSTRRDLPPPSYVVHSSPGRLHVLWRVRDITRSRIEQLQKCLASELATDRAATSCAQMTRVPGFFNHKRQPPVRVRVEYVQSAYLVAADLPNVPTATIRPAHARVDRHFPPVTGHVERARRFLAHVDPAIAGQHGDARTFRVCCRVVRGFDLSDEEAVCVLAEWNARCEPPWSEGDLRQKVTNARRYGREAVGGFL